MKTSIDQHSRLQSAEVESHYIQNIAIIEHTQAISPEMMALLLTADPNKEAVLSYLPISRIVSSWNEEQCVGIAVLICIDKTFELKNIAVLTPFQGKGIAKQLIAEIKNLARNMGATTLEVGTGNSSLAQLALYQKCGFRMTTIISNFFQDYPEEIYENGIRCIDMVRLQAKL